MNGGSEPNDRARGGFGSALLLVEADMSSLTMLGVGLFLDVRLLNVRLLAKKLLAVRLLSEELLGASGNNRDNERKRGDKGESVHSGHGYVYENRSEPSLNSRFAADRRSRR